MKTLNDEWVVGISKYMKGTTKIKYTVGQVRLALIKWFERENREWLGQHCQHGKCGFYNKG